MVPAPVPVALTLLRVHETAIVTIDLYVVAAGRCMKLHPVTGGRPVDYADLMVLQAKQNRVADDVAIVVADNELFCLVTAEILE